MKTFEISEMSVGDEFFAYVEAEHDERGRTSIRRFRVVLATTMVIQLAVYSETPVQVNLLGAAPDFQNVIDCIKAYSQATVDKHLRFIEYIPPRN